MLERSRDCFLTDGFKIPFLLPLSKELVLFIKELFPLTAGLFFFTFSEGFTDIPLTHKLTSDNKSSCILL